ncbi:unnamed protein product [Mytilus edulis]|uniref:Tyr recombinase domain-containing protein n=1 Tax=Mytilus edulis TaxID=6550 RepID=A0A8S3UCH8_MYTED|nr:unnamed protein product [Mytilus edulis]
MATKRRFASLEDEDRENLLENVDSKNTKRQTKTAINGFREYLTEKSLSLDFESYDDAQLDDVLSKFYMEMRNKNGEMYKKTTMQSYRQGLQRHLSKTRDIDILKGDNFKKSQKAYQCMTKELKRLGLAAVEHYPAIADADIEKMYMFFCKDLESPKCSSTKVFVDIMIHFGRRGRENLATLTRQDFAVQPDPEGTLYIYKTHDELTKNHQTDSEKSSDGRMYEIKGSDRCPVRSFVKYIRRLNPKCNKLFQQPKLTAKDGIHYDNIPLGHNKLGIYMNEISKAANLSREYTNHSCRATTVHILDEAQIPSRHIMSVTGHKSEASLKTYSGELKVEIMERFNQLEAKFKVAITTKTGRTDTQCSNTDGYTDVINTEISSASVESDTDRTSADVWTTDLHTEKAAKRKRELEDRTNPEITTSVQAEFDLTRMENTKYWPKETQNERKQVKKVTALIIKKKSFEEKAEQSSKQNTASEDRMKVRAMCEVESKDLDECSVVHLLPDTVPSDSSFNILAAEKAMHSTKAGST